MNIKKMKWNLEKRIALILFSILMVTIIYAVYKIITTPSSVAAVGLSIRSQHDYVIMLLECALGILVMFVPSLLERRLHLRIPNYMYILYFVFLFCTVYLGEVNNFYYYISFWDIILHSLSAAMLVALGFTICGTLSDSEHTGIQLSPVFIALFAFCFALAVGALWEIYEYSADEFLKLNMQKFRLLDGTLLVGHAALADTMKDIIVNTTSAFVVSIVGYFSLKIQSRRKSTRQ